MNLNQSFVVFRGSSCLSLAGLPHSLTLTAVTRTPHSSRGATTWWQPTAPPNLGTGSSVSSTSFTAVDRRQPFHDTNPPGRRVHPPSYPCRSAPLGRHPAREPGKSHRQLALARGRCPPPSARAARSTVTISFTAVDRRQPFHDTNPPGRRVHPPILPLQVRAARPTPRPEIAPTAPVAPPPTSSRHSACPARGNRRVHKNVLARVRLLRPTRRHRLVCLSHLAASGTRRVYIINVFARPLAVSGAPFPYIIHVEWAPAKTPKAIAVMNMLPSRAEVEVDEAHGTLSPSPSVPARPSRRAAIASRVPAGERPRLLSCAAPARLQAAAPPRPKTKKVGVHRRSAPRACPRCVAGSAPAHLYLPSHTGWRRPPHRRLWRSIRASC